ncbi:T9SS type A sorting domain-containing protein [Rhodocytophaga rosea]|uniref:T9SS type A sorting domain-containing protein n=1 Tax=Rhodocytophaga rosea TaxID=2704465 RepID=A0A6C0GNI4_9BACT|nr:PQQ-dependent sugar dehydrogenase [Rhodocytophaga rosea]QHT69190.1 T9SS type A sorting domain-containing protein [Rhodocytophaga rosea]
MKYTYLSKVFSLKTFRTSPFLLALIGVLFILFSVSQVYSQKFPAGFSQVSITTELANPTVMAFAPDGRIFVAEQSGRLRIIKNGILLDTPFVTLKVNASGERGLIGITLDPNFTTNGYMYLYYTVASGANNRISRFTANGDVAVAGSEKILLNLDPLSKATNHNGGAMHFGKDGKLYVAVGENARPEEAQNLNNYHGKLLRINPDGSAADDNPFLSGPAKQRRIWAYGLRNPFTFSVHPTTGKIFVNDVGSSRWEEINDATNKGQNFGWPRREGVTANPAYDNPVYTYQRLLQSGDGIGCAITGGTFFDPASGNYPSQYKGTYFFQDFCNGWINYLDLSDNVTKQPFATGLASGSLSITTGRDGNLYYLNRTNGTLYKIVYNSNNTAPSIYNQPDDVAVSVGEQVSFTVSASGTGPLQYQWQKNGVNIAGATSATYSISNTAIEDAGQYRVIVKNAVGNVTSRAAILTIRANTVPEASIITPANGALYSAGQTINFSGSATDAEDGTLPASAFSWEVVFHHDTHSHDGPPVATGVKNGSFIIPASGETSADVWYRIFLTVTDSEGATHKTYRDIYPRTTTITLTTQPAGLELTLDGQPVTAPTSVEGVEGLLRSIGADAIQTLNNTEYTFDRWAHGGSRNQTIEFPEDNSTYTAIFKQVTSSLRNPENPINTVNGLNYSYYEGDWNNLPNFASLSALKTGTITDVDLSAANRAENFGFRFTGYIQVPADGEYTFYTISDDGSQFFIGNTLVVDNDGLHSREERSGTIGLKAGKHAFSLNYFQNIGGQVLDVAYQSRTISKRQVPVSAFYRIKSDTPDDLVMVKINFQPSSSDVPSGYLADMGEVFANRGNGFTYGWNQTTFHTRDRGPIVSSDSRYYTLNHMQKEPQSDAIWQIALPDGIYQVTVVCSDPLYTNQINDLSIEGEVVVDEDSYDAVDEYEVTVEVTDGRLTIKPAPDAVNAKISFVDIKQVSASARVASAGKLANLQMDVFPNPVSDKLSVKLFNSQAGQVKLTLTDVLSRPVQGQLYQLEQGEHLLSLPVHSLKAGSYLLQISTPSHSFSKRITIVK